MQVKIISTGDPYTTKIIDMNGVEISGAKSITWKIEANNWATAVVEFENVAVDVAGDLA